MFRTPSGKCLVYSVSVRHYDDRWRNVPGVFRKASNVFFIIFDLYDLYRSLPTSHGDSRSAFYFCNVELDSNWAFSTDSVIRKAPYSDTRPLNSTPLNEVSTRLWYDQRHLKRDLRTYMQKVETQTNRHIFDAASDQCLHFWHINAHLFLATQIMNYVELFSISSINWRLMLVYTICNIRMSLSAWRLLLLFKYCYRSVVCALSFIWYGRIGEALYSLDLYEMSSNSVSFLRSKLFDTRVVVVKL